MAQTTNNTQTVEITNFGGRLTRYVNGDLNSGMAKFSSSWGYDPFTKPGNLTWLPAPTDITGSVTDLILDGKMIIDTGVPTMYAVGNSGGLYKITPISTTNNNLNTTSVIGKISDGSPTFNYGGSLEFYSTPSSVVSRIYVGHDKGVNAVSTDGSDDIAIGTAGSYLANSYRPLKRFVGKLFFGNGNTIGAIDSTGTVTSTVIETGIGNKYSELNPPLSTDQMVRDLEVTPDGNYLSIVNSNISLNGYEKIADPNQNIFNSNVSEGGIARWNGSDLGVTAATSFGNSPIGVMKSYLNTNMVFSSDTFGTVVGDGINKLLTLPNNKPPLPNAVSINGNFITWTCAEIDSIGRMAASMYYFGSLDQENPPGLYRIFRIFPSQGTTGFFYQVPFNTVVSAFSKTLDTTKSSIISASYGKHYFSTLELTSTSSIVALKEATVYGDTTSNVNAGSYETQTQLFSKKITVKQVRVYCEPTVSGNSFQIQLMGSDGTQLTNGLFTYTYAAGTDPTQVQGSLERIDWNPSVRDTYALGLLITNNSNTNMTIHKIEIDYAQSGK